MIRAIWIAGAISLVLLAAAVADLQAAEDSPVVEWQEGQSLRELAAQYLGDPDLWPEILRANNIASLDALRPGQRLVIPAGGIAAAAKAIDAGREGIADATRLGAVLFAPEVISGAVKKLDQAVRQRQAGDWQKAVATAKAALALAVTAGETAKDSRDQAAEAVLSDRQGAVEGRRQEDVVWSERERNELLIEEEKVRTQSASTAQITFRDESRLRLQPNSQALIQRMRVDPLSRQQDNAVRLVEGDFYALLSGKSSRKRFELKIPDVETEIDSKNFWVRQDDSGAKFTNYDDRKLQVEAQGQSVTLGRNEAAVVRTGRAPNEKMHILVAPELLAPPDDTVALPPGLRWSTVTDAAGYWIEIALDPGFKRMATSRWGLKQAEFATADLAVGTYYWRAIALDKFGVPGERSEVRRFQVAVDVAPPFLTIETPGDGAILRKSPIKVEGTTESDARLTVDGRPVAIASDGSFTAEVDARPGPNTIVADAIDAAGNATQRTRVFTLMPDSSATVRFDDDVPRSAPDRFLTAGNEISLAGASTPKVQLLIHDAEGVERAATFTDVAGRFRLNLPLRSASETFTAIVVNPSGFSSGENFSVEIDSRAPDIRFAEPPPTITSVEWLDVRGDVRGGDKLALDGKPVSLVDGAFDERLTLKSGVNTHEFVVTDAVGNVRIERLNITLDQNPPELVATATSSVNAKPGVPFTIEVAASDPSGVKQAASFTVQVGTTQITDLMRYDAVSGRFQATVVPAPGVSGRISLRSVDLEDYAGNKRTYTFK